MAKTKQRYQKRSLCRVSKVGQGARSQGGWCTCYAEREEELVGTEGNFLARSSNTRPLAGRRLCSPLSLNQTQNEVWMGKSLAQREAVHSVWMASTNSSILCTCLEAGAEAGRRWEDRWARLRVYHWWGSWWRLGTLHAVISGLWDEKMTFGTVSREW